MGRCTTRSAIMFRLAVRTSLPHQVYHIARWGYLPVASEEDVLGLACPCFRH